MDFCSINIGITNKAKSLSQVGNVFNVSEGNMISKSPVVAASAAKERMAEINNAFGGTVISYKRGKYTVSPAKNVINAYLLETKQDILTEAKIVAQTSIPIWLVPTFNTDPLNALMEIAQQYNLGNFETTKKMYGDRLVDLALELFPDTKMGDKIGDYRFDSEPALGMKEIEDNVTLYNLKAGKAFNTLQDIVLQRMANSTGNPSYRNIVSKLNNRYYITSTDKMGVNSVNTNVKRFGSFLAFNNVPTNLFSLQKFTTRSGNIGFKVEKTKEQLIDQLAETKKTDKIGAIILFLSERFGYKEDQVVSITRSAFKAQFPNEYKERMNAAVVGNKMYLFVDSNTNDITVEEMLHPFINALASANPSLFANLLAQAKKEFPMLTQETLLLYADQSTNIQNQEIVTKALSRVFNNEQEESQPKSLKETIKEFAKWLVENFKDLFNYYNNNKYTNVHLDSLSPDLSLQQLSALLNTTDSRFDTEFGPTFYNQSSMTNDMYDDIYKSLTDPQLEASIGSIITKLPETVSNIKRALDKVKDDKERVELNNLLKDIHEVQIHENKVKIQFRTVVTIINLLSKIKQKVELIDKSGFEPNEMIIQYNAVYKLIKSVDPFKDLLEDLYNVVEPIKGKSKELKMFYGLLDEAINIPGIVEKRITNLIENPLVEVLAEYNAPFYANAMARIKNEIKYQEDKINSANSTLVQKERASKKKAQLQSDIDKLPTKETFSKIFRSEFRDANSISLMLESGIVNGHPLVSTLMSIIEDVYYKAAQDILKSRSGFEIAVDKLTKAVGKSVTNTEDLYKPITTFVKIPMEVIEEKNPDGTSTGKPKLNNGRPQFQYKEQRALLNYYDPKYLQDKKEIDFYVKYLFEKIIKARTDLQNAKAKGDQAKIAENEALEASYTAIHQEELKIRHEFNKNNSEREYKDEIYYMYELLDREFDDGKGGKTTVRKLKGDIYEEIQRAEDDLKKNFDAEARKVAIDHLALLKSELRQLKNKYNKDLTLKEGTELEVVNIITEYDELRMKYGKYMVDDKGQARYDMDIRILEDEFAKGVITPEEYDRRKSLMVRDEIHPDYYNNLNIIYAEIAEIMEEILNVPSLAKSYDKAAKETIKVGYEKIREFVRPFRDKDGMIDGILMTESLPIVVQEIKKIQDAVEVIKRQTQKLTGLSVEESMELRELYTRATALGQHHPDTPGILKRRADLRAKRADIRKHAKNNQALVDALNGALAKISQITEGTNTHYYGEAIENEKQRIKETDQQLAYEVQVKLDSEDGFTYGNLHYKKNKFGRWETRDYSVLSATAPVAVPLYDVTNPLDTGDAAVRNIVFNNSVDYFLRKGQWWKDNHYTQLRWNKKQRGYIEIEVPIYIWQAQAPVNQNLIVRNQPSSTYGAYKIDESMKNPNFTTINSTISAPKPGKYENAQYKKLATSKDPNDKAYLEFLEYSRATYYNAQTHYNENMRMGDILPAIVKTGGENLVNFANNAFNKDFYEMGAAAIGAGDNDTAYLMGGSISKTDSIPVRFTGTMDKDKQSANIPAMVLVFELAAAQYNRMTKELPTIESIQNLASKVQVTEAISMSSKLNFLQNVKNMFNKTGHTIERPKETKQTNLNKTVDNFIQMFVYGRTSKSAVVNTMGKAVDINKMASGVMSFAAKSIFIGNIFSAVKNSVATRVQTMIQVNVQQGVYSQSNFNKANAQAVRYIPELMKDYTKVGNKSLIGQVLDYFSVMPDNINGQLTSKTEYTVTKDAFNLLSSPKAMSEFEVMVTQFLTFANNEMVLVNGKKVPLGNIKDIFEKGKDGVAKLKDGVVFTDQQERSFIKLFRKYTREIAGAYRQTEQTELETYWGGKLVMYMHKYLTPGITNRYAGRRYSIEEGDITEGYYGATFKNLVSLFRDYSGDVMAKWDDMDTMERAHFIKFCKEMAFMLGLFTLTGLMGGDDGKEELVNNGYVYNFVLAELMATKTETETFAFAVGFGIDDLIRILKNPIIASQQIANVWKMFPLAGETIMQADGAYYQQNTGTHRKGDSKLLAQFLKVLGYTGKTWDGPQMVKQQQMIQTLR